MSDAQEEPSTGRHRSASVRFVEQYLRQGQQGRLAGLLLGQLDAFNRIASTFGHDQCEAFCATYSDKLRETLPPKTPIIRLSERRFAVVLAVDSMSAIMDARDRSYGGESAAIGSGRRHVSRRCDARHRRVSLARRRCSDVVSPRRACAEGSARERARVRHLSTGCDPATSGALEIRDRAYACRPGERARGVFPAEGRDREAPCLRRGSFGAMAHAIRTLRSGGGVHSLGRALRQHRADHVARLRPHRRAPQGVGRP